MLVYYRLNLLADASPDPAKFPLLNSQPNVVSDMYSEAQQFMNYILWNDKLTGVLLSQTAFVNSTLAQYVYQIPIPSGATPTNFVQTTFPASAHRTGIITNAAYITSVAGADRESVVKRGLLTKDVLLCLKTPPPPLDTLGAAIKNAGALFDFQTEQQQVDYRKSIAVCASCHGNFDSYGLVLDGYDNLGVTRTTEPVKDMTTGVVSQVPIAYTATLPPTLGGGPVVDAVDLAQKLAASDVFTHCEMQAALQLAMGDINTAYVEMPTPPDVNPAAAGCAVLAATQSYSGASGQTFSDLLRAAVVSPTFLLRTAVQ
jgi:hypothetical protein